jgi:hypothetical protein
MRLRKLARLSATVVGQLGARTGPFGAGGEVAPPRIIRDADLKPVVMHLKIGFAHSGPEPSTNCRYCTSSLRQPRRRCAEKAPLLSMPAEPLHFSASCLLHCLQPDPGGLIRITACRSFDGSGTSPCYAGAPCHLADVKPSRAGDAQSDTSPWLPGPARRLRKKTCRRRRLQPGSSRIEECPMFGRHRTWACIRSS